MLLALKDVSKVYQVGNNTITALNSVSFSVKPGEFVAVMGPSGSGKSTFLQVASMLGVPTAGEIYLKGNNVTKYNEVQRAQLRNTEIGFIFQQFNLLPRTSALENVMLPLGYAGLARDQQKEVATNYLNQVGLGDRLDNTPAQLSGGQQQRVAVARALVNDPSILFADEPTGNLDSKSGKQIQQLLTRLNKAGKTIILVTHDKNVAKIAHRQVTFLDGTIASDSTSRSRKKPTKKTKKP